VDRLLVIISFLQVSLAAAAATTWAFICRRALLRRGRPCRGRILLLLILFFKIRCRVGLGRQVVGLAAAVVVSRQIYIQPWWLHR
jgi:hypothetical protein